MVVQITPRTSAPMTTEQLGGLFAVTGLVVDDEALRTNAEIYLTTLALIRRASVAGLGETPPAIGFNAAWS
ncbi:hypothetical protein [Gordonia bronchialis]|uniref:hypothetical protein n=1 Tax=Gordonia bronchialis TaxID=2054 RepID=UPI00242EEBC1|nr:hypothetical protein [Gordonia bronchialis]